MPTTVTSPNMTIVVPVPQKELGPQWAQDLYTALYSVIDAHNHTTGNGVLVPTAGIGINADLTFASFNATTLRSSRFASQSAALALGTDIGCLYNVLGDAYWNNASGTQIQLTKNGLVNATFSNWNVKTNVTGNYTIQSTDAFQFYFVNTTGAVTINLPASNTLTPGRFYKFVDYLGTSETHAVSFVPNGSDHINGSNSTFSFAQNGGELTVTTDGAGNFYAVITGLFYLKSTGINLTGNLNLTGSTGITETATTGNISQTANGSLSRTATTGNITDTATAGNYTVNAGGASGVIRFEANGTTYCFVSANASGAGLGIGTTPGTDPTITRGTGVPATTEPNGSIFLRTDGTSTSSVYVMEQGSWAPVAGALTAPVAGTTRATITGNYTVDTGTPDYFLPCDSTSGAFNITLPAPTSGRTLVVIDKTGQFMTNNVTLVRHGSENINNVAASRALATNYGVWTITSPDGTNWVTQ